MSRAAAFAALLTMGGIVPAASGQPSTEGTALPSTVVQAIQFRMMFDSGLARREITEPLQAVPIRAGLSAAEQFWWGEFLFLSLDGPGAHAAFGEVPRAAGWEWRRAQGRRMLVEGRGFGRVDQALESARRFRRTAGFDATDVTGAFWGFQMAVDDALQAGDHERAVSIAEEAVDGVPWDAPYEVLSLPMRAAEACEALGREEELHAWVDKALQRLSALSATLQTRYPTASFDPSRFENAWWHSWIRIDRTPGERRYRLQQRIESIERFLACNRDGDAERCG